MIFRIGAFRLWLDFGVQDWSLILRGFLFGGE